MRIRRVGLAAVGTLVALLPVIAPVTTGAAAQGRFYLVRFEGRITEQARAAAAGTGLRIVDYYPSDSYIAWGTDGQASDARGLSQVRSVSPLRADQKARPETLARLGAIPYVEAGVYGPRLEATLGFLSTFGAIQRVYPARADGLIVNVGLPLLAADLAAVVEHSDVLYLADSSLFATPEDEVTSQIVAGNIAQPANRAELGYRPWLASLGLDGSGVKAAVVDTGVTRNHVDFGSRVSYVNYTVQPDGIDSGGHGSHVAGIMAGDPTIATENLKDLDGFVYGQGMAPKAGIVAINYLESGLPSGGFPRITKDALAAGARMWNASWFTGSSEDARAGYVANARIMDEISRNADFDAAGMEEFLLVFSAGNTGFTGPTQPKEAKNIIAVGSTDSGRDLTGRRAGGAPDTFSSFSSVGPAKDGRVFPTVVAPGGSVVSVAAPEGAGLAGACIPSPLGAGLYTLCSGTSMAAPHVTGSAALIHQWWNATRAALPSPALVRALLVNGADDLKTKNIPNNSEGWGRVNLSNVFSSTPLVAFDQTTTFDNVGETFVREVDVANASQPLRITLTWQDAPAAVNALPALVNDLDLRIEQLDGGGNVVQTWLGNVFLGGQSKIGGSHDRLNNLENVYLNTPAAARYRITVTAHNLPGDGVPESGDATDQDFVLIARNAVAV